MTSVDPFSLWQPDGLGHPLFLVDGAWHPLTLLLRSAPARGGVLVAALVAGAMLYMLFARRIPGAHAAVMALLAAMLMTQQPYGTALFVFGLALSIVVLDRYVAAPSRAKWLLATLGATLSILSIGPSTAVWWIALPIAALSLIPKAARRSETLLGLLGAISIAILLAAPWWVGVVAASRERAPGTAEAGALVDEGTSRTLDLRSQAHDTFASRRLMHLRPLSVKSEGSWSMTGPMIDALGITRVVGSGMDVPRGFHRAAPGVLVNDEALPRFFLTRSFVVESHVRRVAAYLSTVASLRENGTVDHVPDKIVRSSNGLIAAIHEGVVMHGEGGSVAVRHAADGHFTIAVDSHGWNLLSSSEPWWEGWRVYRNHERLPPVIVNGAFVGTFMPPGPATIELRYRPSSFDTSLRATLAGLILTLLTMLWHWPTVFAPAGSRIVGRVAAIGLAVAGRIPAPADLRPRWKRFVQFAGSGMARIRPWIRVVLSPPPRVRAAVFLILLAVYGGVMIARRVNVAGGADSSGYLNEARLFSVGSLDVALPLSLQLEVPPDRQSDVIPLGFTPGRQPHTMVPTYPWGVPIEMAVLRVFGDAGPFFLSPLAAMLSALLLYRLARHLGTSPAGAWSAAAILALCPTVIFQGLQPISDVVAMFWAIAAIHCAFRAADDSRFAVLAGVCVGIGVLVRPTQILLLPAVLLAIGWRPRCLLLLGAAGFPFAVVQMAIAHHLYGHALTTGYGSIGDLMSWSYVLTRFPHYSWWLAVLLSPVVFPLGLVAFGTLRIERRVRGVLAAWFIPLFAFYCFYGAYDAWWYTRFLLPSIPALILGAVMLLSRWAATPERRWRQAVVIVTLAMVLVVQCLIVRKFQILAFARGEHV